MNEDTPLPLLRGMAAERAYVDDDLDVLCRSFLFGASVDCTVLPYGLCRYPNITFRVLYSVDSVCLAAESAPVCACGVCVSCVRVYIMYWRASYPGACRMCILGVSGGPCRVMCAVVVVWVSCACPVLRVCVPCIRSHTSFFDPLSGTVHFPGLLNEQQQLRVVDTVVELSQHESNRHRLPLEAYADTNPAPVPSMFYRWASNPSSFKVEPEPTQLLDLCGAVFEAAYKAGIAQGGRVPPESSRVHQSTEDKAARPQEKDVCPPLPPDRRLALYNIMYPHDGVFGAHLDGARGWVANFCFGHTAQFFCSKGIGTEQRRQCLKQ